MPFVYYDVFDGNYARTYNLGFGDYYDHFKDITINILLIGVWDFFKFDKISLF